MEMQVSQHCLVNFVNRFGVAHSSLKKLMMSNETFQLSVDHFFESKLSFGGNEDFDTTSVRTLGTEFLSFYWTSSAERIEKFMNQLQSSSQAVIMLLPRREASPEFVLSILRFFHRQFQATRNFQFELGSGKVACSISPNLHRLIFLKDHKLLKKVIFLINFKWIILKVVFSQSWKW